MDAKIENDELDELDEYDEEHSIANEFIDYIGFSVSINDEDINSLLTDKPYLLLREETKCLVCDNISACDIKYKYILIQHDNLTVYNVIKELIKKRYKKKCNHRFLETFYKINQNEFQIGWGS